MMLRGRSMARNAYDHIGCTSDEQVVGMESTTIQRSMERPSCPFMIQNTWAWGRRPHVSDLNPLKFLPKNPYLGCNSNIHRRAASSAAVGIVCCPLCGRLFPRISPRRTSASSLLLRTLTGLPRSLSFMQNVQHLPPFRTCPSNGLGSENSLLGPI